MIILKLSEFNIILITFVVLFLLYICFVFIFALIIDKKYFVKRITGNKYIKEMDYKYYKSLKQDNFSFVSNNIIINGNSYYYNTRDNKKILIFSNGFNTIVESYLPYISYFAKQGFIVYSYDYAGVGKSDGKKFKGMPQAIMDLECCIKQIKKDNPNTSITLVGHSMGAYASCNVLNLEEVDKVIAISPFNDIVDVVGDNIYKKLGKKIFLFPIIYRMILNFKFKKYSSYNTFNTLKYINKKVLLIHGEEDKTVKADRFINAMISNQNSFVQYLLLENKQHDPLLSFEAINYNLFLKHQISDLMLKYNRNIPSNELEILNKNINYELKYKLDGEILRIIENFIKEV